MNRNGHIPDIIRMSETEYSHILICYDICTTPFGELIIASTDKGICFAGFAPDNDTSDSTAAGILRQRFRKAEIRRQHTVLQNLALSAITGREDSPPLHLYGTDFQIRIWRAIACIPYGCTATYGHIASAAGYPRAIRAAGTATGRNPVAVIIPCHRVLPSSGGTGQYFGGPARKALILRSESQQADIRR